MKHEWNRGRGRVHVPFTTPPKRVRGPFVAMPAGFSFRSVDLLESRRVKGRGEGQCPLRMSSSSEDLIPRPWGHPSFVALLQGQQRERARQSWLRQMTAVSTLCWRTATERRRQITADRLPLESSFFLTSFFLSSIFFLVSSSDVWRYRRGKSYWSNQWSLRTEA